MTYTRICLMAPYFPKISYISSAVILYGKLRTYKILLTSGGSRTYNTYENNNITYIYRTSDLIELTVSTLFSNK
jgi:hypothetical protein